MQRRSSLSRSFQYIAAGAIPCASGCGTIFHSERNYQPHSRDIDWKVAALDGLGLLLFFVPGVVAFIVDFHTGAIYLPPEYMPYEPHDSYLPPPEYIPPPHVDALGDARGVDAINTVSTGKPALHCVEIAQEDLYPEGIQAVVEQQLGKPVDLKKSSARVAELHRIEDFDAMHQQCQADPRFGIAARQFFRERIWSRSRSV